MTILHDCEIWFPVLDPKYPNKMFDPENPTWECQIRTTNKDQKKEWEDLGMTVKPMIPDNDEKPYYRVNLKKKQFKRDGSPSSFVELVDSELNPVDPTTVGNGSRGNIKIFQYEYQKKTGGTGIVSVLMGIQLTKHIIYVPKVRDTGFEKIDRTIVVKPEGFEEESKKEPEEGNSSEFTPTTPTISVPSETMEDERF